MKTLSVILGLNYKDGNDVIQTAQLIRDGKAIGSRDYVNGQCVASVVIDGLSLENRCYFVDEASDVCRLNPPTQIFNQGRKSGHIFA